MEGGALTEDLEPELLRGVPLHVALSGWGILAESTTRRFSLLETWGSWDSNVLFLVVKGHIMGWFRKRKRTSNCEAAGDVAYGSMVT